MRCFILLPVVALFLYGLGALAQDDGGCPATGTEPYDYSQALCMSYLFYEAQRSGYLPEDNRIYWRNDSATDDGSDAGVDLSGGFYDAGDHVKFHFPLAFALTVLSWGLVEFVEGYEAAGQTEYARDGIKWGTDYLLKCHGGEMALYAQVGDGDLDHMFWGRPEEMTEDRPVLAIDRESPGSDLAGETAAALAAASMVFERVDAVYSLILLDYAREMFDFADQYRAIYTDSAPNGGYYTSVTYADELAWAACWMYKATGEQVFMDKAEEYYEEFDLGNNTAIAFHWDEKIGGVFALMAELNPNPKYMERLERFLDDLTDSDVTSYTDNGLFFNVEEWGSLRHSQGVSFIALRGAALGINPEKYEAWVVNQLSYALGSQGHSFVVGFGVDPPTHCHHRGASCNDLPAPCDFDDFYKEESNGHTIFGALVGGPSDLNDYWHDNRSDYVANEVALDYNAAYTGVLARTIELLY